MEASSILHKFENSDINKHYENYYLLRYQNGIKINWNWSAFFLPIVWLSYRGMYKYGIFTCLLFLIYAIALITVFSFFSGFEGTVSHEIGYAFMFFIFFIIIPRCICGMLGDFFYIQHLHLAKHTQTNTRLANILFIAGLIPGGFFVQFILLLCWALKFKQ